MKKLLSALVFYCCFMPLLGKFERFIAIEPQWNFITLKNDTFQQFAGSNVQFTYNQAVGFPGLALDIGMKSYKTLRSRYTMVGGLKVAFSNSNKKIKGLVRFENVAGIPEFLVSHDFNICSINPYYGLVWQGEKTNISITGGYVIYDKLLKNISIYENTLSQGYAGVQLKSKTPALAGRICFSAQKYFWEDFFARISYEYTRGSQSYKHHVFIDRPTSGVQEYIEDIYLLAGAHEVKLLEAPTIKFGIHTLSLSVGVTL